MSKYSVLITGANGLLGHEACVRLAPTHHIHALVHGEPSDPVPGVHYHMIDFAGPWSATDLPDGIEAVFHLAQSSKFRDFPDSALDVFDVNIRSTAMLLDYAYRQGVKRFVYASSGGVYGAEGGTFDENAPIDVKYDLGYYLGSKLCGEILAQNYTKHMDVSILRFFFLYGKRQNRSMLLPRLVDNIREGRPLYLQGREGLALNPIHVSDAALCLEKSLTLEGSQTINIAGKDTYSLKAIATMIENLTGTTPLFEHTDGKARNLLADISLMGQYFGAPKIPLAEGLKDLL
ncbi:MAG: NAD(P)-dependent oxidoreductase [Alphaproteobacteria bacterium]|nr:NAD(P)-dependent oxidoreductase [Alphaproteobacteria bacterium]